MTDRERFELRTGLIRDFLAREGLDGVLLTRADNFAMATGGKRNYVNLHADLGANSLFVPRDGVPCFVGNAIEVTRQVAEELGPLGCGSHVFPWFEGNAAAVARREFPGELASDDGALGRNVHADLAQIRALLTDAELDKYRLIGRLTADAVTATLRDVEPGMAEADIAARLVAEGAKRHCHVPVALVAADERIAAFRHPLPTVPALLDPDAPVKRVRGYVMLAAGFQREGLTVSMTRFRQVGDLPEGVEDAYRRICAVDLRIQHATRPGRTLGDVFTDIQRAYAELGFHPEEWHNHHQGGPTGYAGRTAKGAPGSTFPILPAAWRDTLNRAPGGADAGLGMAFAWNPSAPGVKSEDTFLLHESGDYEVVTETTHFESVEFSAGGDEGVVGAKSSIHIL